MQALITTSAYYYAGAETLKDDKSLYKSMKLMKIMSRWLFRLAIVFQFVNVITAKKNFFFSSKLQTFKDIKPAKL